MHSTSSFLQNGLLIGGLVVLAIVGVAIISRFRREMTTPALPTRAELLEEFRQAFEKGEISREEYLRIQEKLSARGAKRSAPQAGDRGPAGADPGPVHESPDRVDGPSLEG